MRGKGCFMGFVKTRRALVVGCGEFGLAVADRLSSAGCSVVAIDKNPAAFNGLTASFGGETVVGDGADVSVLEEASRPTSSRARRAIRSTISLRAWQAKSTASSTRSPAWRMPT